MVRLIIDLFGKDPSNSRLIVCGDSLVAIMAMLPDWFSKKLEGVSDPSDTSSLNESRSELLPRTSHEVITGVTILSSLKEKTFADSTKVTFEKLTELEIDYYIDNFKPYDKAGAYGIQEWIGIAACSRIEGSYFNVVGLPVQKLYKELKEFIR